MTVIEDTRRQLRAARKPGPQKPPWRPPELADFPDGARVLAFDASLANIGWGVLAVTGGRIVPEDYGTIRPKTEARGYMETWERALALRNSLWDAGLVVRYMQDLDVQLGVEAPIVGAGHRKESSLIAGMTVWMMAPHRFQVVSPTSVSAVLLGDPKIKSGERKPAIRAAVCRLIPEAASRSYNEHVRDSMSVGITILLGIKEAP